MNWSVDSAVQHWKLYSVKAQAFLSALCKKTKTWYIYFVILHFYSAAVVHSAL